MQHWGLKMFFNIQGSRGNTYRTHSNTHKGTLQSKAFQDQLLQFSPESQYYRMPSCFFRCEKHTGYNESIWSSDCLWNEWKLRDDFIFALHRAGSHFISINLPACVLLLLSIILIRGKKNKKSLGFQVISEVNLHRGKKKKKKARWRKKVLLVIFELILLLLLL